MLIQEHKNDKQIMEEDNELDFDLDDVPPLE
jgi:hypothetical protein